MEKATLKAYLEMIVMTQQELANKLGVTQPTVNRWCQKKDCPRLKDIPKIAEALGITNAQALELFLD